MSWSRHLLLPTSSDPIWAGRPGRTTPPPTGARDSQLPAVPPDSSRPAVGHTLEGGLGPPAANSSTLCAPCSLELSCLPTCPQLLQFFLCPVTPCLPRLSSTCDDPRSLSTGHGGRDPTSTSQTGTPHPAGTPWVSTSSWQRGHFIHCQESRLALWTRLYTMASAVVCPDGFSLLGRPPQDATFPPPIPRAILVSWPSSLARVERPFPGASQQDAEGHSTTSPCCSGSLCPFWWPSAALSDFVGLVSVLSSPWGPRMLLGCQKILRSGPGHLVWGFQEVSLGWGAPFGTLETSSSLRVLGLRQPHPAHQAFAAAAPRQANLTVSLRPSLWTMRAAAEEETPSKTLY